MANLTPDNLEELQKAAILAQILVNNENRLATLQRCGAPEKTIAMQKNRLLDFEEKVRGNSLATELLPQARQVVAMRETRSKFLQTQTFLGKVEAKIDDYCTANLLDPTDIDVTGSDEEILTHFSNTVATGDAEKIITDLCVILAHARFDIEMRTDVPPPPPQYRISAATQFAFSVANLLKDEDE